MLETDPAPASKRTREKARGHAVAGPFASASHARNSRSLPGVARRRSSSISTWKRQFLEAGHVPK